MPLPKALQRVEVEIIEDKIDFLSKVSQNVILKFLACILYFKCTISTQMSFFFSIFPVLKLYNITGFEATM